MIDWLTNFFNDRRNDIFSPKSIIKFIIFGAMGIPLGIYCGEPLAIWLESLLGVYISPWLTSLWLGVQPLGGWLQRILICPPTVRNDRREELNYIMLINNMDNQQVQNEQRKIIISG